MIRFDRVRDFASLAALCVTVTAFAAPPATPVRDVPQTYHGVTVPDPYRDLEDVKSPATQAWFKAQGIEVVLIGPAPHYEQSLPRLLALAEHLNQPDLPARRRRHERDEVDAMMAGVARRAGVPYLSIMQAICPGGVCQTTTPEGKPMQWDQGHLSRSGSQVVGQRLRLQEGPR